MKSLTLNIYRDEEFVETKTLSQEIIKIGKLKSSHICLEDDTVARMHAVIEISGGDVRVIDLGSASGTSLNGQQIDKNAPLGTGDTLSFGPYRIQVEVAETVAAAPQPAPQAVAQTVPAPPPAAAAPPAAAYAASSPAAAYVAAPPVAVDLSGVETHDGQVAEVVAMYGTTALDVTHVGQVKSRKSSAPMLIGAGTILFVTGLGLFGYEVTRDWATHKKKALVAQQEGLPAPRVPGMGTGGLGLAISLLGLAPLLLGGTRLRERATDSYTIGEGHDAVFHVPPQGLPDSVAYPLVSGGGAGDFTLNFTREMTGDVTLDGQRISLQDLVSSGRAAGAGSSFSFPLPPAVNCRVRHGDVTFHVNTVNPGAIIAGRGETDWPFWAYSGGTGVVSLALYILMRMIPANILAFDFDEDLGENRFVGYMNQPDEVKEEEPPPETDQDDDEEAGGTGQRHKGEEGKMGKPTSKNKAGLYAMKGPKDAIPQMARNFDPDMTARQAGILGVLSAQSGHFLASPFGGAFAVGNDDEDVWGGLTGTEIGEAYGVGGLGLVGTGRGGGGTGEGTIGLGNTGLIGKGGGGGTGSGYGRGSGAGFGGKGKRRPRVRQAKAKVQGALDKNIIRRIVRAHINEVTSCYNQGLTKNPNLAGRVAINFVITGTGKVGTSVVQESTLKDRSVANCIAKAVRRWKFPRPKGGGNVIVTYPFKLST
ncbi:MAG: AgmX/PglI C-terminal domain-containing protein [Nannocystaceae bacterium]